MTGTPSPTTIASRTTGGLSLAQPPADLWSRARELFEDRVWGWVLEEGREPCLAGPLPAPRWHELVISRLAALGPRPHVIEETDNFVLLAARFASEPPTNDTALVVEIEKGELGEFPGVWTPEAALRTLRLLQIQWETHTRHDSVQRELEAVSAECTRTYEEISLLHSLARNLRVSNEPEHLAKLAVDWIRDCLAVEAVAIELFNLDDDAALSRREVRWSMISGEASLEEDELRGFFESLALDGSTRPLVINENNQFESQQRLPPGIGQLVAVPIVENDVVFGHLALMGHVDGGEFGTIEASLAASVASILGVHAGNCRLYGKQANLLENVVKAMVSAIDAKDPYTCGHSDRVARISVRLARQLELPEDFCATIYLSGLLHDVGKIGVDDSVLRKEGRLTDEEFEHIKRHPRLGAKILADIEQFSEIIPGVLHHHEQWNGRGYPDGLAGEEIPLIARIIAVADSFDAMTSDRPYRKGMPLERVEEIFRGGRYTQWDGQIVDAYFEAREEILEIIRQERAGLPPSVAQWSTQRSKSLHESDDVRALGELPG